MMHTCPSDINALIQVARVRVRLEDQDDDGGVAWQLRNNDDPRWQTIELDDVSKPLEVVAP